VTIKERKSRDAVSARGNSAPAPCHVFDTPLKRGGCAHLAGAASLSVLYREERHSLRRDTGKYLQNREPATHKFPVGAYVLHQVSVRSSKETFRITRLLPDDGAGFQYRIKGEQDGFERVVKESSLEAIGL
jgi:hypothetical protein